MDLFYEKLLELASISPTIYIMTHRYMDLDGFGAALGLSHLLEKYNSHVQIIVSESEQDESIEKAREKLGNKSGLSFVQKEQIPLDQIRDALVIVLDVHKREMVEYPELLDACGPIVILDHHIKGDHMIEGISLSYIRTNVSSTVEIIVDFLKKEKDTVDSVIATIMLAGMYIDTNNFNIKTTSNTYLAGAYLMDNGANNVVKQELFQENKKTFIRRQKLLKNSYMINENMILCALDKNIYVGSELAKIADELLQFEDVEASFAVGYVEEGTIGISARSLGMINVEKVMKKMGGGGHKTDAAARIKGKGISKVKEEIMNLLK